MTEEQKYLETKKLNLNKHMNGYDIPYAYLCAILKEYAEMQVKKLTIPIVVGQSEQLKCIMKHDDGNCNCDIKHCEDGGW